jgi:NADH-quinone oxidoreductase subunit C
MGIEEKLPAGFLLTSVEKLAGYMRKSSVWPATFGLACCAIEMMAVGTPDYDIARFGMERFSATPRQADLMIVAGRVSQKMAPVVRQVYDQMVEPKWVISMGVCASSGGMFNNYAIVQGVDHIIPVDVYLPGCPPRPQMLLNAILTLHEQIQSAPLGGSRAGGAGGPAHRADAGAAAMSEESGGELAPGTPPAEVLDVRRGMFGAPGTGDTSGYGGLVSPVVGPAPAERPYAGWWEDLADQLTRALADGGTSWAEAVERVVIDRGELTLAVRRDQLVAVAQALRDEPGLRFEICTGVSGVHYPQDAGRELHAVYHLLSITHGGRRVRVEVTCPDDDRRVPSVVSVWPGVDWHERETWDMFGIVFEGHPALTRILMPDDWPGHPQRKDYPLGGIPVEYKGAQIPPPDERRSYS